MPAIPLEDMATPARSESAREAGYSDIDEAEGAPNQGRQPGNGQNSEHPLLELNRPRMLPPERTQVSMTRWSSCELCCLSIDKGYEGGAIDCQRAIVSETLGFSVYLKWVANARYQVRSDRYTGAREVQRGMDYTTPFAGPYVSVKFTKETGENPIPVSRKKFGYGTRGAGGSYDIEVETERIGSRVTKAEQTTTVTRSLGESVFSTNATTKNLLPTVAEPSSQGSIGEAVVPHRDTNDAVTLDEVLDQPPRPQNEDYEAPPRAQQQCYVVLGILSRKTGLAQEKITISLETHRAPNLLFDSIRSSSWALWPLHKRMFSLKSISGFGLYHCHVDSGYHTSVEIDDRTKQTLSEFYLDYKQKPAGMDERWMDWVHENLNGGNADPREGNYTLELLLRWSITKIMIYGLLPVVGSLVVGIAYMQVRMRGADDFGSRLAVVQTAWGVASYVVGAAGVTLAILGVITQLADA